MTPKQVLLIDKHPIVCLGLTQLLQSSSGFQVCGQCKTGTQALDYLKCHHVDIAIIDVFLNGQLQGTELIKEIYQRHPSILILVFSMLNEDTYLESALRAGIRGYVSKEDPTECLLRALTQICEGHIYISETAPERLLQISSSIKYEKIAPAFGQLSEREGMVFRLIAQGYTIKQIAKTLHISDKTADVHRTNIRRKLHLPNSVALYHAAFMWWGRLQNCGSIDQK